MNKICLIAGANSEIACVIAKKLVDEYTLILCRHKNHQRIDELLKFQNTFCVQADLRDEAQVDNLMKSIFREYKTIDLMINCVGKNISVAESELTEKIWDEVISSNLKPAFFLCKFYRQYRSENSSGCIINFSSTAGIRPLPSSPHYITAKAGLIALSTYYAKIMAPHVRVNVIAPGFVQTQKHNSSAYDSIRDKIPLKRMATLSEIAETIKYIADCNYLTGQTIILDGGLIS